MGISNKLISLTHMTAKRTGQDYNNSNVDITAIMQFSGGDVSREEQCQV